jgi:hypothetical protein
MVRASRLLLVAGLLAACQSSAPELSLDSFVAPAAEKPAAPPAVLPPPPYALTLEASPLIPGEYAEFHVTGAAPGRNVVLTKGWGLGETCRPAFDPVCLDIDGAWLAYPESGDVADASGEASFYTRIPEGAFVGGAVYLQAVEMPGGRLSNVVTSTVTEGAECVPDAFEANDSQPTARALGDGSWADLTMCAEGEDWYVVNLVEGDLLTWSASFSDGEGDIDLAAYTAAGALIDASTGAGDYEELQVLAEATSTVYLRAYMYLDDGTAQQGNIYDMTVDIDAGDSGSCEADIYEPNDSPAAAYNLNGVVNPGDVDVFDGLSICLGEGALNLDVYRLTLGAGETLRVTVNAPFAEGDVDLRILDGASALLALSGTTSDQEVVEYTSPGGEVVYIRLNLVADTGLGYLNGAPYNMVVERF